jgi:hypothetical protein
VVQEAPDSNTEDVLLAHRKGAVSLFVSGEDGPQLQSVLSGLPTRITGIAFDSRSHTAYLTNTDLDKVEPKYLIRVLLQYPTAQDPSTYLLNAGPITLNGISTERDTKAVAFSPLAQPDQAFVVTSTPAALAVVNLKADYLGSGGSLVTRVMEAGAGASRVSMGTIGQDPRLFAFVSCFDSRQLYIFDVAQGVPVAVVHGFSGPFEMALDSQRKYLYVADFKTSVIRIVDLSPIVCDPSEAEDACGGEVRIVATLGKPTPPEEIL